MDESVDFIKRVVATPGDRVEYRDKVLYVNGVEQAQSRPRDFVDDSTMVTLEERTENLSGLEHSIAVDHRRPSWVPMQAVMKKNPPAATTTAGSSARCPKASTLPWATTVTTVKTAASGVLCRMKTWSARLSASGRTSATWAASAAFTNAWTMSGTIEINKDKRPSQMLSLEALEERIGYVFQDKKLLRRAVTHRSFAQEHNERLEFLGDSVLNCVIGYALFLRDKHFNEGELASARQSRV